MHVESPVCRRMPKRIYVPLPDAEARRSLLAHLLSDHLRAAAGESDTASRFNIGTLMSSASSSSRPQGLSESQLADIVRLTDGYSGSDLAAVMPRTYAPPLLRAPYPRTQYLCHPLCVL